MSRIGLVIKSSQVKFIEQRRAWRPLTYDTIWYDWLY